MGRKCNFCREGSYFSATICQNSALQYFNLLDIEGTNHSLARDRFPLQIHLFTIEFVSQFIGLNIPCTLASPTKWPETFLRAKGPHLLFSSTPRPCDFFGEGVIYLMYDIV